MRQRNLGTGMLLALGAFGFPTSASAQVGDVSDVNYPGWIAADGTQPTIEATVGHNGTTWSFAYDVGNGATASQEIDKIKLNFNAPEATASASAGWLAGLHPSPTAAIPGVYFLGRVDSPAGATRLPSPVQIGAGSAVSGFSVTSDYPPGYSRVYVRGFVPLPAISEEDLPDESLIVPHDTTNSQRRWTLGPTLYAEVVTGGNRRPATDGFLGFMNLSEKSSVLTDPAPIALKFSLNGETVFLETLSVKLNGVDVTESFYPGATVGADLVGLFSIGSSPLQEGKNVLLTTVDGVVPSNGNTAKDSDRIVFFVDSSLAQSGAAWGSNALNNLPWPEPGLVLD